MSIVTKTFLREEAETRLKNAIDIIFKDLHKEAATTSGDISPLDVFEIDSLVERISTTIAEAIYANC
jgi:hypothetical protein